MSYTSSLVNSYSLASWLLTQGAPVVLNFILKAGGLTQWDFKSSQS